MSPSPDFESGASANSTTSAFGQYANAKRNFISSFDICFIILAHNFGICNQKYKKNNKKY
jgi:hypothetical protein